MHLELEVGLCWHINIQRPDIAVSPCHFRGLIDLPSSQLTSVAHDLVNIPKVDLLLNPEVHFGLGSSKDLQASATLSCWSMWLCCISGAQDKETCLHSPVSSDW